MTNEQAKKLKAGDGITINTLETAVERVYEQGADVMIETPYGDFNASVCSKPAETVEGE